MRKKEFLKKSIATLLAMSIAFTSGSMPGVFAAEQEENAGTSRTTTEVASPQEEAPEEVVVKSQPRQQTQRSLLLRQNPRMRTRTRLAQTRPPRPKK